MPGARSLDLPSLARRVVLERGFEVVLPPDAEAELARLRDAPPHDPSERDLRSLLWSSIDNVDSRDLDQVEVAERDGDRIRLRIGIADVDAVVSKGSALDRHSAANTTSVYTGVRTFPMLPDEISEGISSLLPDVDRRAIVVELAVEPDGTVSSADFYPASVRNHAKLAYEPVGAWLEGAAADPAIARVPGLADQIKLQDEAAERLRQARVRSGALDLETVEARPVMAGDRVIDLHAVARNRARGLIENFMIAANEAMARFLEGRGLPSIQRVVKEPDRWTRIVALADDLGDHLPDRPDSRALAAFLWRRRQADPLRYPDLSLSVVKLLGPGEYALVHGDARAAGHFGLALRHYSHSTAPNRRYADLVTQRILKAALSGAPAPYRDDEIDAIAAHCTERENAARKVERFMTKAAAAVLLADRVGQSFEGIVTGASPRGTYVRLLAPPVEGRVVRGEGRLDVGDRVRVKLVATDPERGYLDFSADR